MHDAYTHDISLYTFICHIHPYTLFFIVPYLIHFLIVNTWHILKSLYRSVTAWHRSQVPVTVEVHIAIAQGLARHGISTSSEVMCYKWTFTESWGYPQKSSILMILMGFSIFFPYKPTIFGYPYWWTPPRTDSFGVTVATGSDNLSPQNPTFSRFSHTYHIPLYTCHQRMKENTGYAQRFWLWAEHVEGHAGMDRGKPFAALFDQSPCSFIYQIHQKTTIPFYLMFLFFSSTKNTYVANWTNNISPVPCFLNRPRRYCDQVGAPNKLGWRPQARRRWRSHRAWPRATLAQWPSDHLACHVISMKKNVMRMYIYIYTRIHMIYIDILHNYRTIYNIYIYIYICIYIYTYSNYVWECLIYELSVM